MLSAIGGAGREGVEQATTDTLAAYGGHHRDDGLGDRRAVGRHDQRAVPQVLPGRPDRAAVVVERHHRGVR